MNAVRVSISVAGKSREREAAEELLALADVKINGPRPWDIRVTHPCFFERVLEEGSLGLGGSYVDGWWDCPNLDQFFFRVLRAGLEKRAAKSFQAVLLAVKFRCFNLQAGRRAFHIGERHYDIGNDLFQHMLDKRMVYTCGYWRDAGTLDEAQEAKLDLVCRKLGLKPGQRLLDIGCGWGGFLKYAAEKYGVIGVGVTVSKEQVELGRALCAGLPVELRLQDYREVEGEFDHIVSLGMFEHVGAKNYRRYMEVAHGLLKDGGFFLLHTIGSPHLDNKPDPWIEKNIFPNSMVPNARQIVEAAANLFIVEDWHNFGVDYDPTLMAWFSNFCRSWPKLKSRYSETFCRMWKYYLLSSAGSFRARESQLWQIVLAKGSVLGGYKSLR